MIPYVHLRRSLSSLICRGRMVVEPCQIRCPTSGISQRACGGLIIATQRTCEVTQACEYLVIGIVRQQTRAGVNVGVVAVRQWRLAPVLNQAVVETIVLDGPSTRPAIALEINHPTFEQVVIACQAWIVEKCALHPFKQVVIE